jgi:hypothetical protein
MLVLLTWMTSGSGVFFCKVYKNCGFRQRFGHCGLRLDKQLNDIQFISLGFVEGWPHH